LISHWLDEGNDGRRVRAGCETILAVVEFDDAVGDVEVFVVVGDDEDSFAAGFEVGRRWV